MGESWWSSSWSRGRLQRQHVFCPRAAGRCQKHPPSWRRRRRRRRRRRCGFRLGELKLELLALLDALGHLDGQMLAVGRLDVHR